MVKMSLMHDLVEIETGDVSVWDTEKRVRQEQNDQDMSQKVFQSFAPDLSQEFILLWNELTANATLEAKIVNGLDRLSPTIQRLITGQGWKSIPVTIHKLDALLLPKILFSKTLQNLYSKIKEEALEASLITW
jgi:putative hydrolase of HD superfamily